MTSMNDGSTRLLDWGLAPKPPEFNALGRQMKIKTRSGRPILDRTSPPFLCPAQALGFALQRRPILLAGLRIFSFYEIHQVPKSKNVYGNYLTKYVRLYN
jgi:hypothetical protein